MQDHRGVTLTDASLWAPSTHEQAPEPPNHKLQRTRQGQDGASPLNLVLGGPREGRW